VSKLSIFICLLVHFFECTGQIQYNKIDLFCPDGQDCFEALNDSMSLYRIANHKGLIAIVFPTSVIVYGKSRFDIQKEIVPLFNSDLKYASLNVVGIELYSVKLENKEMVVIKGLLQGSSGISASYHLILIFDISNLNKKKAYGFLSKQFNIKNIRDENNDGQLEIIEEGTTFKFDK